MTHKKPRKSPDNKIDHYFPLDLKEVIISAAKKGFGDDKEGLITETARILNYERTGVLIRSTVGTLIDSLISEEILFKDETGIITVNIG